MIIFCILVLGFILRLWNINQSLWLDEAAQAIESSQQWWVILRDLGADFHPPLFHVVLSFWISLGTEEWQMRLLPILFSLASIWIVYLFARNYSEKVAIYTAFFLSINPFFIYYSQELRPYMMGCFFAVFSVYIFWKALGNTKLWILFAIITALHLYTSYFALFVLAGQLLFLLQDRTQRKNILWFIGATLIALLTFIPWIPQFLMQLKTSEGIKNDLPGWSNAVATPLIKVLPLTLVKFIIGQINFEPKVLYGILAIFFSSIWTFLIYKSIDLKNSFWRYCICLVLIGLLVPTVTSIFLQIAAPKRLLFNLPILLILLSIGIEKLSGRWKYISLILIINISFSCLFIYETNPKFQRENWKDATQKVDTLRTPHSATLFKFTDPLAPFMWYTRQPIETIKLTEDLEIKKENVDRLDEYLPDKKTVFIFHYLGDLTDPNHLLEHKVESMGFRKLDTFDYPGVGLIDYYQK